MAAKELTILGNWLYDVTAYGNLAANTEWRPSAALGGAELETDEVAEVRYLEITPPINDDGTPQALDHIYFILDDKVTREYVNICGRNDALMFPRRQHVWANNVVYFGDGIVDAMKVKYPGIKSTTLKYKTRLQIVARAGDSAITKNFLIRAWGYKYKKDELPKILDSTIMDPSVQIVDRTRGKTLMLSKSPIPIDYDNWTRLPGGAYQDKPIIMPYFRWSINSKATTVNLEYQYRFDQQQVPSEEMDLYWKYDQHKDQALLINGFGVRAADNIKYAWIANTGDVLHKEHPKGKFLIDTNNNPLHFGLAYPLWPSNIPLYYSIPRFADDNMLIYGDLAYVAIQDNGTQVAANSVYVAVNGIKFEFTA